jgi:hypothetical protein
MISPHEAFDLTERAEIFQMPFESSRKRRMVFTISQQKIAIFPLAVQGPRGALQESRVPVWLPVVSDVLNRQENDWRASCSEKDERHAQELFTVRLRDRGNVGAGQHRRRGNTARHGPQ